MDRVRQALRSGEWLTRERIRMVAVAVLIASAAGFLYLVVTATAASTGKAGRSEPIFPTSMRRALMCSRATRTHRSIRCSNTLASKPSSARRRNSTAGTIRRIFSSSPPLWRGCPMAWRCSSGRRSRSGFICWRSAPSSVIPGRAKVANRGHPSVTGPPEPAPNSAFGGGGYGFRLSLAAPPE